MADTWRERIIRARERPGFLAEDRARAGRWSTCAVGGLLRRRRLKVARLDNGGPVDAKLRRVGISFFAAVLANDVARAEATLAEIENTVRQLRSRRANLGLSGQGRSQMERQPNAAGQTASARNSRPPRAAAW